jgi:malic enzyme
VFNRQVSPAVAEAVAKAAIASGVARRDRLPRQEPTPL